MPSRRRRASTARAVTAVAAAVGVLAVVGAVTAYATTRPSGPTYRTATVGTHTVQQVLPATGTVEPGTSASVSFPTSGTVASVRAVLGAHVTAGQQLAALDETSLRTAVASATASVAHARLTLYQAENGQTSSATGASTSGRSAGTGSASTGSGSASGSGAGSGGTSGSGGSGASSAAISAAQRRLLSSVHQGDQALSTTTGDLTLAGTLCTAPAGPGAAGSGPSASPTLTPSPTMSAGPSPTSPVVPHPSPTGPPHGRPVPTTCAQAQQLVLADETQVQQLQQAISSQEAALDRLLATATKSTTTSTGSRSTSAATSSSTSSTPAVSAAQLAADQAAVDAAVAAVAVADQNLAQAVLLAPISGVVSGVGVTVGQSVSGGSSSSAVDIINPTAHSVSLAVDVTKIPLVKVGQRASVVPDGTGRTLDATVSYVAAAPSTSSGSSYLVRLAFTGAPAGLRDGIQAAVSLVVAQATDALTVPSSAVNHLGALTYVTLVKGGVSTRQTITVGAVGALYTQVTSGLTAGQTVMLADVTAAIPTSSLASRFARFAGAGGLGGLGGATGLGGTGGGGGGTRTGGGSGTGR